MLASSVQDAIRKSDFRIVITGSGGWLGMATLELLRDALEEDFQRRIRCFGSGARRLTLFDGSSVDQRPLSEITELDSQPTILLHFAFLTKDRAESMAADEYRRANQSIRDLVLHSLNPIGARAVFVASSGAAAFADDPEASAAMRLYGSMKRDDEEVFGEWAERNGARALIARIYNVSGPHMNKLNSYALASFILDALGGRAVAIRSPDAVRTYVAIRELMSLCFSLLLKSANGVQQFDSGGDPLSLREVGECVAQQLGAEVMLSSISTKPDIYFGNYSLYESLLREHCVESVSLAQQIVETAAFFRRTLNPRVATAETPC
jgi:nucleoside-diphosphate-sugar epimerase